MKLKEGMVCPVCESGKLEAELKDVSFEYKGERHVVKNVGAFICRVCGESLWDERHEREIERTLTDARRRIDGLLSSDEIKAIRQFFGMTQVQFAKALDIGEKNIARYESGQSTQGRAMDHVLRMLRANPQNLKVISGESTEWTSEKRELTVHMQTRRSKVVTLTPILNTQKCEDRQDVPLNECAI